MAILTVSSFATFAGLLVAVQKLATDPNPVNRIKALADLATSTTTLATVLAGAGLTPLAKQMEARARDADAGFARDPATNDARAIFWQAAPTALADPALMTAGALDADAVTNGMVKAIRASPHSEDFARTPMAERYFRAVAHPTLTTMLANADFIASITPDLWRRALHDNGVQLEMLGAIKEDTAEILALVRELRAAKRDEAHRAGVTDERILALARRIVADVPDLDGAFAELDRAVTVAIEVQTRGAAGSNTGHFVDEVLARMAALSAENRDTEAAAEADRAFAEWEDRQRVETQKGIALLEAGLRADILRRDAASAARRIALKLALESPDPTCRFADLSAEWRDWYSRGNDAGLHLDLEVSIALARLALDAARAPDERDDGFWQLAVSLASRGERDGGIEWQEKALDAVSATLNECTRDSAPTQWARAQNILGNVLGELGTREGRTDRLERAVVAYHGALKVYKRKPFPLAWAGVQMNLGIAYRRIGVRESGTKSLKKAVEALDAALLEFHPETNPDEWSLAQMNLGNAFVTLGERESGSRRLLQAVAAYRASLRATNRATQPVDWAMRRSLLSAALWTLGDREGSPPRLKRAAGAVRPALNELQGKNLLRDWVCAQGNFGNALRTYGKLTGNVAVLECAVAAYRAALAEVSREGLPTEWALTKDNLARGLASIADLTDRQYGPAIAEIDDAIAVFRDLGALHYLRKAENFCQKITNR